MKSIYQTSATSTATPRRASRANRRIGPIAALFILSLAFCTTAGAVDLKPNPEWCKPGYRCLTIDDYAAITTQYIEVKGERDRLQWQRRVFGNFFKPWATVGLERLPNSGEYHPYGLAGIDIGHVSVWAGAFGDDPAYGIGWRF